jgi:hypothetical protein
LNGFITIAVRRPQLQNMAGPSLQDRYWNGLAVLCEDLCRTDLLAEYAFAHRYRLVVTCLREPDASRPLPTKHPIHFLSLD